jgi:TonB family protein
MRLLTPAATLIFLSVAQVSQAADAPIPACLSHGLTPPVALTSHVAAPGDYPPLSRILNESGNTTARYVVQADGSVGDVTVETSSGSLRLDEATVSLVKGFKFKPALSDGKPISCSARIILKWSLYTDQSAAVGGLVPIYPTRDDFPAGAIDRREEGTALGAIIISDTGSVELITLIRQTVFPDLNAATVALLRRQKVTAATVGGKPVRSVVLMPVVWSLTGMPPTPPAPHPPPDSPGDDDRQESRH